MSAYCFFDCLEIFDSEAIDNYRQRVFAIVTRYGGRYVVIGGPFEIKEGNPNVGFPVLIEFPSMERANAWYDSADYADLLKIRKSAGKYTAVFMRGIEEG